MSDSNSSIEKQQIIATQDSGIDVTNHLDIDDHSISEFIRETRPWYRVSHLVYLNICVFVVTLTSTNNGYDGSMLNGLQSLTSWHTKMGNPTGHILGALSNGTIFGGILALPVAPYISDRYGRWWAIVGGELITVIGAVLQGASTNYGFFLVARLFLGFGSMVAVVGSPTLISELAYPTHRMVATAFYNTCWYLGAVIAAWVTYGTQDVKGDYSWRIPSYLQAALPAIQLAFMWMVPESPRYLISRGKLEQAEKVLTKFHIGNSTHPDDVALVKFEMREIERAIEVEKLQNKTKYSDFFKRKTYRKRLFICMFVPTIMQLSGNGLVSYYLSKVLVTIGITETKKQLEINGCLMIYNMVISMTVAGVVNRFRRRTLFLFSTGAMCATYIIWTALSAVNEQKDFKDHSYANGVLAMIFLYYCAYDIGVNGLPFLYITEILPYSHRAKGINIMQLVNQIVLVYNGFVNPIAMDAISWKYYIVYCCVNFCECIIVYFFFPETSGYTLEEVAKVFGDDPETTIHILATPKEKLSLEHAERV